MNEAHPNMPILEVDGLSQRFAVETDIFGRPSQWLHAVENVSLSLYPGESLGVVGESGCGKSTFARAILHLHRPSAGRVKFLSRDIGTAGPAELRSLRRDMQIVLQDPFGALNPHRRVGASISDGLTGPNRRRKAEALLERVGLKAVDYNRYPHEFSGGQRQRICIARALAPEPKLLIADEAVSALDVSVQAQILNLLSELRADFGLSFLFISHNLAVVRAFCDRLSVMYLGRVVETGPTESVFADPLHPYTRALISAMPIPDPIRPVTHTLLDGEVPSPLNPPSGCAFRTRCAYASPACAKAIPEMAPMGDRRSAACIRLKDVARGPVWNALEEDPRC